MIFPKWGRAAKRFGRFSRSGETSCKEASVPFSCAECGNCCAEFSFPAVSKGLGCKMQIWNKIEVRMTLSWHTYRNRFNCLPWKSHILAFCFPLWFYEKHPGRHQHLQDHSLWCSATGDCKWKRLALLCSVASSSTPRNPVTGNLPFVIHS